MVRAYAKPSEPFKLYKRILRILDEDIRAEDVPKLKKAIRFHYERFFPMFLQLEKTHSELIVAIDTDRRNDPVTPQANFVWNITVNAKTIPGVGVFSRTKYVVCYFYSLQIPSEMYRDIVCPS